MDYNGLKLNDSLNYVLFIHVKDHKTFVAKDL